MIKVPYSGRLITFEGGEGAGKSTQQGLLAHRLRARGLEVVTTREPGGCPLAEEIRRWVVHGQAGTITARTELLLLLAARVEHVHQVIWPALQRGAWVLCDRFLDSTLAYQGYGRGLDLVLVQQWHTWAVGSLLPDRTLWLDVAPAIGLARVGLVRPAGWAQDRFEQETLAFHQRVQDGFQTLAQASPDRIRRVDAALAPEQVANQIGMALHDLFSDT
ncbi:MAG: dTMP kinase [Magnetococcales bacterium]|nr:dTMP kinase [Magnetococcales bacterium]